MDNHLPLPHHPSCLVGGWVGGWKRQGGILGCIHVCTEKEVGLEGGGLLLSQGKFQVANSWHACAAGSVTKGLQPAPLLPGPGNPINCVRQRELVSIDPHSAALWLADKGHSHVETNAQAEQPGGGPGLSMSPLLSQGSDQASAWSCFASVLIKQDTVEEGVWRFGLANQILHSPLVDVPPVIYFNPVEINWLKMQQTRVEVQTLSRTLRSHSQVFKGAGRHLTFYLCAKLEEFLCRILPLL